jgi:hypothetical protein
MPQDFNYGRPPWQCKHYRQRQVYSGFERYRLVTPVTKEIGEE